MAQVDPVVPGGAFAVTRTRAVPVGPDVYAKADEYGTSLRLPDLQVFTEVGPKFTGRGVGAGREDVRSAGAWSGGTA